MSAHFAVNETDQFIKDVEDAAVWLLLTNLQDRSESFTENVVNNLKSEIDALKVRLSMLPDSGQPAEIEGVLKFPLYKGRFSAKWIVDHANRTVTLITLADSKYPKELRNFQLNDDYDDES